MRLIDADTANGHVHSSVALQLRYFPTVNPVHAAGGCYCRECKYFRYQNTIPNRLKNYPADYGRCKYMDWAKKDDNFCSYGERREGEKNELSI